MAFTPREIENAQKAIQALTHLHHHRKELEITWAQKNEKILEPTDINFPDIHGFTLLDYAIILQDMNHIQQLISEGAKSNKASDLAKKSENEAILQLTPIANQKANNEDDPYIPLYHRLAYMEFATFQEKMSQWNQSHEMANWRDDLNAYNNNGETPLMVAIKEKNFPYIKYLVEQGCDVNKLFKTAPFTAIDFALFDGNIDVANYLKENGAKLDIVDHEGKCLLSKAIVSGNIEFVKFALLQDINYAMTDYYGRTPVHFAAACENPEIIKLILNDHRCQQCKETVDLLGRDPFQIAFNHDNQAFINQMDWQPVNQNREKTENVIIEQGHIVNNLRYYLSLTNQDPNTLPISGHCNGLSFLDLVLHDKNKHKDFSETLKIISKWQGTYEELNNSNTVSDFVDNYNNTEELFHYFTDHIIFLQQDRLEQALVGVNPSQKSRVKQYAIVGENINDISLKKHFLVNSSTNHHPLSEAQLTEYIAILGRLPNTKVEFGGAGHATSLYIVDSNDLSYYDPNVKFEIPPLDSPRKVAQMITNFKYKTLGLDSDNLEIKIRAYKSNDFSANQYSFFNDDDLPKNEYDAKHYQQNSPNKLTHLHIAVLTDSIPNLNKLMNDGFVDFNATDTNGDTALALAIKYKKLDILKEILNSPNFNTTIPVLISLANNTYNDEIKKILFHAIAKIITSDNNVSNEVMKIILNESDDYYIEKLVTFLKDNYLLETAKQLARENANQNINQLFERYTRYDVCKPFLVELIKHASDINKPDESGVYPIHALAKSVETICNEKDILLSLESKGIDVNITLSDGETPLISALRNPRQLQYRDDFINFLIDRGANVNVTEPEFKLNPLFFCLFYYGDQKLAERLLEHGANVNHQIFNGACVLHPAALSGDTEMVKMLLKYGADFTIKDNNQKTPLIYAIERGNEEIVKLFTNKKLKSSEIVDLVNQSKAPGAQVKDSNPLSMPCARRRQLLFASHEIPESLSWYQKAVERFSAIQKEAKSNDHVYEQEHLKP